MGECETHVDGLMMVVLKDAQNTAMAESVKNKN